VNAKVRWTRYIDLTDGRDLASGTCVFGDYIAIVGVSVPFVGPIQSFVILLRKSDGVMVREWIDTETWYTCTSIYHCHTRIYNCISIDRRLYATGYTFIDDYYGAIYVFDENLGILAKVRSRSPSEYYSPAYDGKALYIGGSAREDIDRDGEAEWVWLIEKRDPDDLSILASRKIYFGSWEGGGIYDVGVEPSTGRIWAVGFRRSNTEHSLIIIFDSNLRELRRIDYPEGSKGHLGILFSIAFDGRYVYVSGWYGVAKFTRDGELVAINRDGKTRYKIVYYNNYLYTFGEEEIRGYRRHMLYIHDTDLNLVKSYVLSEGVNADSHFDNGRPALEGNSIYVAGSDDVLGVWNTRVVVYSLSIEGITELQQL